jgi:hypothetical protein
LVGNCERKRPLGRPMRKLEDDIKMGLEEIAWEVVDWIHQAEDRVLLADLRVPLKTRNFLTSC